MANDDHIQQMMNVLKNNPRDAEAFKKLEENYLLSHNWRQLSELYQLRADTIRNENPSEAAKLYWKCGEICEQQLNGRDDALAPYKTAFDLQPSSEYANKIANIYFLQQNWHKALEILRRRSDLCQEKNEKVDILLQIASTYIEKLKDRNQAKKYYAEILKMAPEHGAAFHALMRLFSEDEQWRALLDLYKQKLAVTEDRQNLFELLTQAASVADNKLKDWQSAIQLYEKIIAISPNDFNTLKILEGLYIKQNNWQGVIDIMEKQVNACSENEQKGDALLRIAVIYRDKLDQRDAAIRCCERAIAVDESEAVLSMLEEMYLQKEAWKDLAEIYKRQSARMKDPQKRLQIYCKIGEIANEKLHNPSIAVQWYQVALKEDPKNLDILKKSQGLLEQLGQTDTLIKSYRHELGLISDREQKLAIYEKIANVYKKKGDLTTAVAVYEEMYPVFPKYLPVLENLKTLYTQLQNYEGLVNTLKRQASLAPKAKETVALYLQIAKIHMEQLKDADKAMKYYHRALEIDDTQTKLYHILKNHYSNKGDYPSLIGVIQNLIRLEKDKVIPGYMEIAEIYRDRLSDINQAIDTYDKVLSIDNKNVPCLKEVAFLYRQQKNWEKYQEIQQRRITVSSNLKEIIEFRFSLCELYRAKQDAKNLERELREILKIDINNSVAIQQLEKLYHGQGDFKSYIEIRNLQTEAMQWSTSVLFQRYYEVASLYLSKLKDIEKAIFYFEKARHLEPNNWDVLCHLEKLYTETKQYEELIGILEDKAPLCEEDSECVAHSFRIAITWQRQLNNIEEAIKAFQKVVILDIFNVQALSSLEKLYEEREEYASLAEIYNRKAKIEEVENTVELYVKAGNLWETKLNNSTKARFFYEKVISIVPEHKNTINSLLRIYRKEERWDDLAATYRKKISISPGQEEKILLLFELASLYREQLQSPEKAIEIYNEILQIDPKRLEAVYPLKELQSKLKRLVSLFNTIKMECSLVTEVEKQKSLLYQMAEIAEDSLSNFPTAIECFHQISKIEPKREVYISLRRLYYKIQDLEKVVWSIDEEVNILEAKESKIKILFEKANLCQGYLNKTEEAIATYEVIINLVPNSIKAYEAINKIYRQTQDYENIVKIRTRQIEVTSVGDKKIILLTECANLWEYKLDNDEKAKECLLEILKLKSNLFTARRDLESLYRKEGAWEVLIQFLSEEIGLVKNNERIVELHNAIGKIYEKSLQDLSEALNSYQRAIQLNSNDLGAIQSRQRIFQLQNNFAELRSSYEQELGIPDIEKQRRIYIHLTCAELERHKLSDIEAAAEHYRLTLNFELDPNNLVAIRGLEEIYKEQEKYPQLQNMLFKELELQKNPHRLIEVHLQLAYLMEDKLNNIDVAAEHFAEAHLSRPKNLVILRRLKNLLRTQQQWKKYAEVVEKEINLCSHSSELVPLHEDLVDIYHQSLHDFENAIRHGEAIIELDDSYLSNIQSLQILYKETRSMLNLTDMYLRETKIIPDTTEKERLTHLYMETGKIFQNELDDLGKAVECYHKTLQLVPAHKESLSTLVKIFIQYKKWEDLLALYQKTVKITKNETEVETLHLKIAELLEKQFQQAEQALLHYQIVHSMNKENVTAIVGMRRLFELQERWASAIEFLSLEVEVTEEKKQPSLHLKMGEYWEEKLGMPHQALTCYQQVMSRGFHRPTAERIMAIQEQVGDYQGLLEIIEKDLRVTENPEQLVDKLLHQGKIQWDKLNNIDDAIVSYSKVLKLQPNQMEAIDALVQLFEDKSKWKELIIILNRKRENTNQPDTLCRVYCKIADIYNHHMHAGNMAIKNYEHALEITPKNINIIHTLQKLYDEWGYSKKLISLYQRETQLTEDEDRIILLHHNIAKTWEKRLFDDTEAIKSYEHLMGLSPNHLDATKALARLYKRYRFWDKLIPIYKMLIEHAKETQNIKEEISILFSLGEVYRDEVKDLEAAIQIFSNILELEVANNSALQALEQMYKSLGRSRDMAVLISKKISLCATDEERIELYIHLGSLYEKELGDPDHAIQSFEYARSIQGDRLNVLNALDWLYYRKQNWQKFAEICQQEIALTKNVYDKADLYYRLGKTMRDHFSSLDQAKNCFLKAIECKPDFREALKSLRGLALREEDWTQAVKYIAMEINYIQDPDEKISALTDLGSLYQNKLKLIQKAKEAYQLALDIDPKSAFAVQAMADIHYTQGEWQNADALFGRLILLVHKEEKVKLSSIYFKWGFISEKLNKKDEAIIRYNNALKEYEANLEALQAVGKLYFERAQWGFDKSQWQEAMDIYSKVLEHPELEDKIVVIRQLAITQKNLDQVDVAIENYQKVLAASPEDIEAVSSLAKLYIEKKDDQQALHYLDMVVKSNASFVERRDALLILAETYDRLEDYHRAIDSSLKAFSMGLEDTEILKKLGELYIKVQDWEKSQEWLDKHYQCLEESEDKAENRCLVARIYEDGLKKIDMAISAYKEALEHDSTCVPAIQGMATIYKKKQDWETLAANYQEFLNNLPHDKKFMGLPIHLALGMAYADHLNNPKSAISELSKVIAIDPHHLAARAALANIKSQDPTLHSEAISEHMLLLSKDPTRVSSYRALFRIYEMREQNDHALRACRALNFLGEVQEQEQDYLTSSQIKKAGRLSYNHILQYLIPKEVGILHEVMAQTNDYMSKAYPTDLEKEYGLKKKDRLGPENSQLPICYYGDKMKRCFDIEFETYITPKKGYKIYLENTQPASLIITQQFLEALSDLELKFILAKYLFYIAQKQTLAIKLPKTQLKKHFDDLHKAFTNQAAISSFSSLTSLSEVDSALKRIRGGIPRKIRKTLEDRVDLWRNLPKANFNAYATSLEFASNRCAMVLTDSLELTINMVHKLDVLKSTGNWEKTSNVVKNSILQSNPIIDVLLYNISNKYGELRKLSGMV
ncbi:tetratricopeptide repeat protein [Candidatus Uabimicrobium sp. HlEnr_7]|uniref:tetratricopeptide repeat protein n=1 Tax=Candidatus Uabimicrobium helgolandensis TaxID=3095367 RepID=UPI0035586963